MTLIKSFAAIAITALVVGQAPAQKQQSPRPTPTPVPGAQIETGTPRTNQDPVIQVTGGGQVNRNTGMEQVRDNNNPIGSGEAGKGRITKLRITVVTGSDDLRSNSDLRAFLITGDGRRIDSDVLNCEKARHCEGIPDGTRRTFEWNLFTEGGEGPPNPEQAKGGGTVFPADVRRLGLSFKSYSGFGQTGDNWNLDKLEVEYVVATGSKTSPAGTFSMYTNSGNPLYRFKTKEEWDTGPLSLPN